MHSLIKNGFGVVLLAGAVGCGSHLTGGGSGGSGHPASGGAGGIGGGADAATGDGALDGGSNAGGAGGGVDGHGGWQDGAVDVANGCDEAVAARTIADLGLSVTSTAQTINLTLPPGLTGAGWDLKAAACQQGGYDITALAGSTVCLLSEDITQLCQGYPAEVWVIMTGGTTACVYKTVAPGAPIVPGVYAVTDSPCH